MRSINWIDNDHLYGTHRRGWKLVRDLMLSRFQQSVGLDCFSWADKVFKEEMVVNRPWCGFFHNVIRYPQDYPTKYHGKIRPLEDLVKQPWFHKSLRKCRGLWTLCEHTRSFLEQETGVVVECLPHPVEINPEVSWDESCLGSSIRLITIGQWMRKFHTLANLELPRQYEKTILRVEGHDSDYGEMEKYTRPGAEVSWMSRLSDQDYDRMLQTSIVFLDLYDVAACNVIMECISTNTPLVVCRLPAVEEYLGKNYPLFFEDIQEAQDKIKDTDLILSANRYLKTMDKSVFSVDHFAELIVGSRIYSSPLFL